MSNRKKYENYPIEVIRRIEGCDKREINNYQKRFKERCIFIIALAFFSDFPEQHKNKKAKDFVDLNWEEIKDLFSIDKSVRELVKPSSKILFAECIDGFKLCSFFYKKIKKSKIEK